MADLQQSGPLTQHFLQSLRACPYSAFFFETPPVSTLTFSSRPFEYVLIDSPALVRVTNSPTPEAFAEYIGAGAGTAKVVTFENLGRDAVLVVPCQAGPDPTVFSHLAQYSRHAPPEQQLQLWRDAAQALTSKVQEGSTGSSSSSRGGRPRSFWLSTSGLGVYWLHLRLDTRPKYYNWLPYKEAT